MNTDGAEGVSLSCKQAARLMSQQQDRALSDTESDELKKHLLVCLDCRNIEQQLGFLRRLANRYAASGPPH